MLNLRIGWGFWDDHEDFVVVLHVKEEEMKIEKHRNPWQSWLHLNRVQVLSVTFQRWKNAPTLLLLPGYASHQNHTLIAYVPVSHFYFVPLNWATVVVSVELHARRVLTDRMWVWSWASVRPQVLHCVAALCRSCLVNVTSRSLDNWCRCNCSLLYCCCDPGGGHHPLHWHETCRGCQPC